jgi:hypothetical protein
MFKETIIKYAGIDYSGRKSLNDAENIKIFNGFSEDLKNRLNCAILFSDESNDQINQRIASNIEIIGKENEVGFILGGKDYPFHSTLLEGLFEGIQVSDREKIFKEIIESGEFKENIQNLSGIQIQFKYILIDKENVLLTSTDMPEEIERVRLELGHIYEKCGLKPIKMKNILHLSIARISKLPQNKEEALKNYKKDMIGLRHKISSDPIILEVSAVSFKSAYDLLTSNNIK